MAMKKYYLRPGSKHTMLIEGERKVLRGAGEEVELSDASYESFKDKFMTKEEWAALKSSDGYVPELGADSTAADVMLRSQLESHAVDMTADDKHLVNADTVTTGREHLVQDTTITQGDNAGAAEGDADDGTGIVSSGDYSMTHSGGGCTRSVAPTASARRSRARTKLKSGCPSSAARKTTTTAGER
jgi:hypothetical protein